MKWLLGWISDNRGQFVGLTIGLTVAILFLTIGFWETVLILACTWIGGYLGAHPEVRHGLAVFFTNLIHGNRGRN